ncbi:MAG TPA: hypothetical protein VGX25_03595 [Actinophytocola sp.]|uniref:hypothetical protein n=1 Tax=Actinophytocola sp. TaxID=1872138 RepID=UPI002DDD75F4|nr:hypothetical protein [Actinophytocola sp.]HEV2778462.1 hypothetical protein [Actinophytocola sp.]
MASSLDDTLIGIYLNDHLAGAIVGTDLAKRLAAAERDRPGGQALARLADEIDEDQAALRDMMAALGVPVRRYKTVAAWAAEKLSRLKPNGRLLARSPLSAVLELEALRLGVEGKAAGWRTLRARAERDPRLDPDRLGELIDRAHRQIDELERLRVRTAAEVFGGEVEPVRGVPRPASGTSSAS